MEEQPFPPFLKSPETDVEGLERRASGMGALLREKMSRAGFGPEFWEECVNVLELGAGQGVVALALSRLTTDSCQVVTIDYSVPIAQYVRDEIGSRLEEHTGELIVDYLKGLREKFDLITICALPARDHRIRNVSLLAKVLKKKGIVFSFVTELPEQMMVQEFELIRVEGEANIWVKKGHLAETLK